MDGPLIAKEIETVKFVKTVRWATDYWQEHINGYKQPADFSGDSELRPDFRVFVRKGRKQAQLGYILYKFHGNEYFYSETIKSLSPNDFGREHPTFNFRGSVEIGYTEVSDKTAVDVLIAKTGMLDRYTAQNFASGDYDSNKFALEMCTALLNHGSCTTPFPVFLNKKEETLRTVSPLNLDEVHQIKSLSVFLKRFISDPDEAVSEAILIGHIIVRWTGNTFECVAKTGLELEIDSEFVGHTKDSGYDILGKANKAKIFIAKSSEINKGYLFARTLAGFYRITS